MSGGADAKGVGKRFARRLSSARTAGRCGWKCLALRVTHDERKTRDGGTILLIVTKDPSQEILGASTPHDSSFSASTGNSRFAVDLSLVGQKIT